MGQGFQWLIRGYQYLISPLIGPRCRFYPTCSDYSIEAIRRFGVCQGVWLTGKRLLKCHPWHTGGVDTLEGGHSTPLSKSENSERH